MYPDGSKSISVLCVVPTLGQRPEWLRATLLSIVRQRGVDLQVRCVAPSSNATVQDLADELGVAYLEDDRPGLSVAINHGFTHEIRTTPEFCMWLGDDDLLAPDALMSAVRVLRASPRAPFIYGHIRYIDADDRTWGYARPTALAWRYIRYGKNFVPQPGSLLRYSAMQSVQWLDEGLKNAMDQDLFTKLADAGRPAYLGRELAAYRVHAGAITSTKGSLDESAMVRDRYRSRPGGKLGLVDRQVNLRLSRVVDVLSRHFMPWPEVPRVDGRPYTDTGQGAYVPPGVG